jgi:antitoxin ParD1/3/4
MAKRKTMNISLSPGLKAYVDRQVDLGEYGTVSEYIRHLIRQEQVTMSRAFVESALREAVGPSDPLTPARWDRMTKKARQRLTMVQRGVRSRRRRSA